MSIATPVHTYAPKQVKVSEEEMKKRNDKAHIVIDQSPDVGDDSYRNVKNPS